MFLQVHYDNKEPQASLVKLRCAGPKLMQAYADSEIVPGAWKAGTFCPEIQIHMEIARVGCRWAKLRLRTSQQGIRL